MSGGGGLPDKTQVGPSEGAPTCHPSTMQVGAENRKIEASRCYTVRPCLEIKGIRMPS